VIVHQSHDTEPPPTERDPMVAPETLSAIGRELTAVGEHVANVERQMGSFREAVWEELQEQKREADGERKLRRHDSEKLSDLKIRFMRFEEDATQTMELTKGLCERILRALNEKA
jgi:hypothetical protein